MPTRAVCFDVMGTLFELSNARKRLEAIGAPKLALEAWFSRVLHTATAATLTGDFHPFPQIAQPALESVLAQLDLPAEAATDVVSALAELDPHPEVREAIERLGSSGLPVVALTNGTRANTRKLLARAAIERHFDQIIATEDVGVYKPHPAVYRRAAEALALPMRDITLVAAHGWDVAGALSAGMDAVWVTRLERRWPLPPPQAPRTADDLVAAVENILAEVA
jgi:2-haloacid dehalogenase